MIFAIIRNFKEQYINLYINEIVFLLVLKSNRMELILIIQRKKIFFLVHYFLSTKHEKICLVTSYG